MARSVYERLGSSALTGQQTGRRYTVVGGDTLPSIAQAVYPQAGYDSEAWRQIAEANDLDDLDDLAIGTVLTIPTLDASST